MYTTVNTPREARERHVHHCYTPMEATRGIYTTVTHPGRLQGAYTHYYTPREATRRHIPPYTHTQGGYKEAYTTLYTPLREAKRRLKALYILLREALRTVTFSLF